jgi:hypothetical protein
MLHNHLFRTQNHCESCLVGSHPTRMPDFTPTPDPQTSRRSRTLICVILGIIVVAFLAFMLQRPNSNPVARPTPASQR